MKPIKGIKIDIVPVLGVTGLLIVLLYFLFVNLGGEPLGDNGQRGDYSLFYRLYKNLGYRLNELHTPILPKQQGDLLIYFDRDLEKEELDKVIEEWVKPGGSLFVAGITGLRDPLTLAKLDASRIYSVYEQNQTGLLRRIINFKGELIKHIANRSDLVGQKVILDSEQGPLLYQMTKGAGSVLMLTDSDLLKYDYLKEETTAIFINELIKPYFKKRIYIIWGDTGRSSPSQTMPFLTLFFKDKMGFISLQLIWILLLFILWQGTRFGEPQLLDPYRKRTLSEHLKAVANFYQKTNSLKVLDQINLEYFIFKLNKITGWRFKSSNRPEELNNIVKYLGTVVPDLGPSKIRLCFSKAENQTLSQLQSKEELRDIILKSIKKERTHSFAKR
ncbi:MAG: hypothetical protein GXY86_12360 [Firmicutes bacterium]|nr:hypothetical protein [Bacillota bacterium]